MLRLLIDMNLSPSWVEVLRKASFDARMLSAMPQPANQRRQQ